jgi:phosphatidate cytidylyltransferase
VIGVLLIGPFFLTEWLYLLPFVALAFLMGMEFVRVQIAGFQVLKITIGILCAVTFFLMHAVAKVSDSVFFRLSYPLLCIFFNAIWIRNLYSDKVSSLIGSSYVFKSFAYIAMNLSAMHLILYGGGQLRVRLFITCMVLVWLSDILAFGTGSLWGRKKLFPSVSPSKTVEGLAGSIIGTSLIAVGYGISTQYSVVLLLILSIGISGSSVLGDLVESKLKRSVGVKDSGNLIPGHGGVLDRFDGFIFALPTAALIIELFYYV